MKRRSSKKEELESEYFDLEKDTNVQDDLNEENVEETTLNYATKVAKSEELVKKAYVNKSVKCFNIDTKICQNISSFSKTLTQFVRTENKIFNAKLFAEKLITFYNPAARVEEDPSEDEDDEINQSQSRRKRKRTTRSSQGLELEDFQQIGKQLSNLINDLPIFNFAYGSFTPEVDQKSLAKERKQRTKRTDFSSGETVKPKDYDEIAKDDNDAMTKEIDLLHKDIEKKCKNSKNGEIEFYDAVIDPDCLTSSVTNIFHSAFMVKEGMLNVEFKDGKNLVRSVTEEESKNVTELGRKQQVLRFNKQKYDNWRKLHGHY